MTGQHAEPSELQRMWAPWRTARMQGESNVAPGECPFCVLPGRDPARDKEWLILDRRDDVFVILNAYPYNPGHLMVVPYAHVGSLDGLDQSVSDAMWRVGQEWLQRMDVRLRASSFNIGMNLGDAAGGSIGDHVHLHVVPRWVGDTNFMTVTANAQVLGEGLADLYDALTP